jgi:hypothetical protein
MKKTHTNSKSCECYACKYGMEALDKFEIEMMEKYGWYIHVVVDDGEDNTPTGMNAHTHGLVKSFDHPDLQWVIPMGQDKVNIIASTFHAIVDNYLKKGIKLQVGEEYSEVIGNSYKVTFAKAKECGREILRIILPDQYGYMQKNEPMDEAFATQYEGTFE